jgi:hypothetical protein
VTSVASRANSMRKIFVEATFAGFSLVSGLGGSIPCGEQNLGSHKGKRQELGSQVDFCIGRTSQAAGASSSTAVKDARPDEPLTVRAATRAAGVPSRTIPSCLNACAN